MFNEWLLTNGLGGYAMGSVAGEHVGDNRRRYHGLLVAATSPPVGRVVALHSIVDAILTNEQRVELATQRFASDDQPITHPDGWQQLTQCEIDLPHAATWRYDCKDFQLQRRLEMLPGRNAVTITWTPGDTPTQAMLHARPLTPLRDFHALDAENEPPTVNQIDEQTIRVHRHNLVLELRLSHGNWQHEPQWWRNFHYEEDLARGQACTEDVFSPALAVIPLRSQQAVSLQVTMVEPNHVTTVALPQANEAPDDLFARLRTAASQFVVQRKTDDAPDGWSASILAGYPWFADWGRDAMISLPGLMLCTGRIEQARSTLHTFARHLDRGLIPNRFDDYAGKAHYNTVDASLWFIQAVRALHRHGANHVDQPLLDACRAVVDAYRRSEAPNVAMDRDGLIAAGSPRTQLTWMDAQRDGITFTPRHGKAVEINALWHAALQALALMTDDAAEAAALRDLARGVAISMQEQFWNDASGCCFDVLVPDADGRYTPDDSLRPNQIFAVSLDPSPLTSSQQRSVIDAVCEHLLTPYGLRTLSPHDAQYRGRFEGDMHSRDGAYHQGTVWPWLIGPYGEAVLRFNEFSADAAAEVREMISPLLQSLDEDCFGQLAEVYDGDSPHRASGCPAQAWSVAELLRLRALLDVLA